MDRHGVLFSMLVCALVLSLPVACSSSESSAGASPRPKGSASDQQIGPVFLPEDLLSAEEASEVLGVPVTIDDASLYKDERRGMVTQRYVYDVSRTTINALLQIEENGLKPASDLKEGNTAQSSFRMQQDLLKDEITEVKDLGDAAFTMDATSQLHMVYGGYYIVVAFRWDIYDSSNDTEINIELGRRILANLKRKL
jgi:hypothetical protein